MSLQLKLQAFILAAGAAFLGGSAQAATYATGDLLLGFVAGGGQGSDSTLVVNLGASSGYRDASDAGTNKLNFLTIGSQLSSQFGSNWYDRTDLHISLYGTASSSVTSSALFNGDPARTLYVSQARNAMGVLGSASSAGWSVSGNTAMTDSASGILNTSNRYGVSTSDVLNVAIIADGDANTLDEFTRPTTNTAFGSFNGGIESTFASGLWGSFGPAGNVEAALDLYRIQARNDVAGQYGAGAAIREGDYSGTFTINQNGAVSFVSAVPEPGSAAMLGLACAGVLFRRRRRSA